MPAAVTPAALATISDRNTTKENAPAVTGFSSWIRWHNDVASGAQAKDASLQGLHKVHREMIRFEVRVPSSKSQNTHPSFADR